MPPPAQAKPTRPILTLARAASACRAEASLYGKCIVKDYNDIYQGKCAREFAVLRECYLVCPFRIMFCARIAAALGADSRLEECQEEMSSLEFWM